MVTVKVYHIDEVLMPGEPKPGQRLPKGKFSCVGSVEMDAVFEERANAEAAYQITQNIQRAWINDERVNLTSSGEKAREKPDHPEGELSLRSSMVGDIFDVEGSLWIVASVGWYKIEEEGDEYVVQE